MARFLTIDRRELSLHSRHSLKNNFPEITDEEGNQMLHALGADSKPFRKYLTNKHFHAYRNCYYAGGDDVELWNGLVKKGLAERSLAFPYAYRVSVKGIHLLEYLTQSFIYDAKENVADCKEAALTKMIERDVYCAYECWLPTSARQIARDLAIPVDLARKTLRTLADDGWVQKDYIGGIDDEGLPHCAHGWRCTEKTRARFLPRNAKSGRKK